MRLSLRNGILLALFGAQTLTAVVVGLVSEHNTQQIVTGAAQIQIAQAAQSVAAETSEYLDPAVRIGDAMKQAVAVGNVGVRDDTAIERLMLGLMASNPDVSGVELGRNDGSFVYVHRNGDGYQTKTITTTDGRRVVLVDRSAGFVETKSTEDSNDTYDPRARPWYQLAESPGGTLSRWTAPYVFFSSRTPGITNAHVITDTNGGTAGVLGVDIELSRLASFIASVPVPGSGTSFVTDSANRAIALPELKGPISMTGDDGKLRLRNLDELGFPLLPLAAGSPQGTVSLIRAGGVDQLATTTPLKLDGLDWRVVVHANRDNITGSLHQHARRSRLATFGTGLASLLFAIPLMFGLSGPMRRLHRRATIDQLTGVLNRAHLVEEASRAMKRASPVDRPLAVAMFDLDNFKELNDQHGHEAGDQALQEVARRFGLHARSDDFLGRLGGDEFAIIMPSTDHAAARVIATSMCESVTETPIQTTAASFTLHATVGVASLCPNDIALSDLLRRADLEMLAAKPARRPHDTVTYGKA
jgi:diguanylate cyclase (GGDEF)-like protein